MAIDIVLVSFAKKKKTYILFPFPAFTPLSNTFKI